MKLTVGREYDCKLEICKQSNIVTLTKYQKVVKSDLAKNFGTRFKETTEEQYQENKRKNIRKSASRIIKLVKHNVGQYKKANGKKFPPIGLTLTFKDNVQDWYFANTEHRNFIKRLNYFVYGKKCSNLAYISVPELQKRGAIHYHIFFFNLPYIDKDFIEELWGNGSAHIEKEVGSLEGEALGKYITKYMTKQFYSRDKEGNYKFYYDKATWEGKKTYFASKNLFKPVVFKFTSCELNAVEFVLQDVPFIGKDNTFKIDDEEILFSTEQEYKLSNEKINYLLNILPYCRDSYIRKDFYFNPKGKSGNSMLSVGKAYTGSPYYNIDFTFASFIPVEGGWEF